MKLSPMLQSVERYYTDKLAKFGRTPQGADWKSAESQTIRFDQLMRLIQPSESFTINDYGCGYGALVDYLKNRDYQFKYRGFDVPEKMIAEGRQSHEKDSRCEFYSDKSMLSSADFTVASGIFNVKLDTPESEWLEYILATLTEFHRLTKKAFAFNALTSYSDPEFMRSNLYYANPLELFDYCQKHFSRKLSLLHDYPLYEFTIIVRLSEDGE
jgi:hypothetical protein